MEKVEYHTSEEKKTCDWIRCHRQYQRKNYLWKHIQIQLLEIEGKPLFSVLNVGLNKKTGKSSYGHYLKYMNKKYSPTTKNNKLRCINTHSKEQYNKSMVILKNARQTSISYIIEPYILHREIISYYESGNIGVTCCFRGINGRKLKYIDETP